ncbi:4a-hydroxytetrahydrobiopterin dehydratase [Cryptosporangium sp. NPDC048952]|uniref:4a-hydroxytetrahydrobiopterin dehydratase n=1 Tax=Cryptosporangium sp. NPDC048952 TaxID=3363961 RepID=UPI00371AB5FA
MADLTLSADEITASLVELPGWSGDTLGIRRTVEAESFPAAIALVDRVAVVAEARDHHPDIDIRWRKVTFTLVTHSAGGVTAKDLDLASEIDALVTG